MRRTCCSSTAGSLELSATGGLQQFVVGDAAPEEERQPRRQIHDRSADRPIPAGAAGGFALDAEQKAGRCQHALDASLDSGIETWPCATRRDRNRECLNIGLGEGPAVGARGERRQNLPRTRLFGGAAGRACRRTSVRRIGESSARGSAVADRRWTQSRRRGCRDNTHWSCGRNRFAAAAECLPAPRCRRTKEIPTSCSPAVTGTASPRVRHRRCACRLRIPGRPECCR